MKLQITDKYRIVSDPMQWIVQEYKGVAKEGRDKGKERWNTVGYYVSLEQAMREYCQYRLRTSDCQSLAEACDFMKNTVRDLSLALTPDFEVPEK